MQTKILFIHHSTGGNLIKEGHLREKLHRLIPDVELWDHSYNLYRTLPLLFARFTHHKGLTDNKGHITGTDYNIVLSNNSPREYVEIFSRDQSDATIRAILNYDVIAFKNCYPTTKIVSNVQLDTDKKYYESIRTSIKKYPKKTFILFTPPPLRKSLTKPIFAKRAKELAAWLTSADFHKEVINLHVFNFFNLLADENGFLKKEYERMLPWDSHPNKYANIEVSSILARYLASITKNIS